MYGREKLEYYIVSDEDIYEEEVYLKNQADKVMDAMEARIKELELYDYRRLPSVNTESFKNIRGGVAYEFEKLKARIKELESQCTQYQSELMNRNPAFNTAISKMETTTPPSPTTEDSSATEKEK